MADAAPPARQPEPSEPVPPDRLRPSLPWGRWALVGGLLLFEYLAVSFRFDIRPLAAEVGWLSRVGTLAPFVLVAVTGIWLVGRRPGGRELDLFVQALSPLPRVWPWALAHAATAAGFFFYCQQVLGSAPSATGPRTWLLAGWALSGCALLFTALGLALPARALGPLGKLVRRPVALGLALGGAAWCAGLATAWLWPLLSHATLSAAVALLAPIAGDDLVLDVGARLLGIGDFQVEVSEECSGAEGMGLITVLGAGYLVKFRQTLHLPRALIILPLGIVAAYLANVLRIAALVWVGSAISPDVAMGGFHSKAGWALNCAIALGLLTWVRRSHWLSRDVTRAAPSTGHDNPTAYYLVPLIVSLALALLTGMGSAGFEVFLPLRVAGVLVALWFFRRPFLPLRWEFSLVPVLLGVVVFGVWILLAGSSSPEHQAALREGLAELGPATRVLWLVARVVAAIVVAPLVEELAFRGFLLRRLVAEDFSSVGYAAAARRPGAILISAVVFGAVHQSAFVAGTLAGIVYALALVPRGRLGDAVIAHALTNALLVIYALLTGDWAFLA